MKVLIVDDDLTSCLMVEAILNSEGFSTYIAQNSMMLGFFDTITPEPLELNVIPGDRIFLYSDGLIEMEIDGMISRSQGIDQLLELCHQTRSLSLKASISAVINELQPKQKSMSDDIVMLAVEV